MTWRRLCPLCHAWLSEAIDNSGSAGTAAATDNDDDDDDGDAAVSSSSTAVGVAGRPATHEAMKQKQHVVHVVCSMYVATVAVTGVGVEA